MDRDALIAALPGNATFNEMFPHQRKQIAENFIESILDAISQEDREPDDWETSDLAAAIGLLASSWYNAALAVSERALTPVEERSPLSPITPAGSHPMRHLRDGLAYVRGMTAPAA